MGFFDRYLAELPLPHSRTARPAWSRPTGVLPGVAPVELVLARTDDVAVGIPGLLGYPNGFEFHLAVRVRSRDHDHHLGWYLHGTPGPDGRIATEDLLRLAVVYPDGRVATNLDLRHRLPDADGGLVLAPEGGGGGDGSFDVRYWVHPLPPPGSVTLVCEWPRFGVPETRVEVPASAIRDASARAVVLWPGPEDAAEQVSGPEPSDGASANVSAYTSSLGFSYTPLDASVTPPAEPGRDQGPDSGPDQRLGT